MTYEEFNYPSCMLLATLLPVGTIWLCLKSNILDLGYSPPPPTSTNTLWQTGGAHPTEMLSCYGPYPEIVYLSTLIACNAMN